MKVKDLVALMNNTGSFIREIPEMAHLVGLPQNPTYHHLCVYGHTREVVRATSGGDLPLLAAMFHDIAKGLPGIRGTNKQEQPSDLGHEEAGAPIAMKVAERYLPGLGNEVGRLVRWHGIRPSKEGKSVLKALRGISADFSSGDQVRAFVPQLVSLMKADASAFAPEFAAAQAAHLGQLEPILLQIAGVVPLFPGERPDLRLDLFLQEQARMVASLGL